MPRFRQQANVAEKSGHQQQQQEADQHMEHQMDQHEIQHPKSKFACEKADVKRQFIRHVLDHLKTNADAGSEFTDSCMGACNSATVLSAQAKKVVQLFPHCNTHVHNVPQFG